MKTNTGWTTGFLPRGAGLAAALLMGLAGCGDDGGNDPDATTDATVDATDAGGDAAVITDGAAQDASTVVDPDGGAEGCSDVTCDPDCAVYVDRSLDTPGSGSTPQTALATVQAGVDAAASLAGACCTCEVRVAEGRYGIFRAGPSDTLRLRERVHVYGGFPAGFVGDRDPKQHSTTLDGQEPDDGTGRVYHVVTGADEARLDGFVITGGEARADANPFNPDNYGGGLISLGASPTVVGCVFHGNGAVYGGAVYTSHSEAAFHQCRVEDNAADETGGGLHAHASALTVSRCAFASNTASDGGGLHLGPGSDAQVSNTTFWDNGASGLGGGVLCDGSEPLLTNTSFSQNSAAAGGALYSLGSAHPRLINSVLWGDAPDELDQSASASVTARYCDVQGGCTVSGGCTTDETGNLDVDPLYLDPTEGDLRLWMESPVVDQGDNTAAVAFPLDREGDTRILDGDDDSQAVVDLGADEVRYSPATMPVIYVDPAATGANDGTSWADAYTDLRAAFAAAPAFHQIWVAEGTYAPSDLGDVTESFVLPAGVVLFGGFAPDQGIVVMALRDPTAYPAVLTGDIMGDDALGNTTNNAYHTVTSGNYAVLDGFTLTAGYNNANTSYGDGKGACLDIREGHHFWLRNSRVHGCIANLGGAVHARPGSHAVIEGCVFEDNEALQGSGGAVRLQEPGSGTTLSGCTFDGNHAGYMGGGLSVYSGSGVRVTGCTFTGNSTGGNYAGWGGGGAYFEIADNVLVETTGFSGNTASAGGGAVFKDCSGVVVQSSTFDANQVSSSVTSLPCDVSHRFMEAVGGGAYVEGTDLIVAGSTFSSNTAIHSGSTPCNDPSNRYFFGVGGGIFTRESAVDVLDTTFLANQAKVNGAACLGGAGAGIGSYDADLRVVNTTFRNNAASAGSVPLNTCTGGGGGGLWTYHDWDPGDHLSNCVFVGNTATDGGSGLRLEYSLTRMYGLTVTGNSGSFWGSGAMLGQGTAYVYNSIFWGNTGTSTYQTQFALGPGGGGCYGSRRAYTYYTLIADTLSGDGCLDACTGSYGACVHPRDFDPGFVNAGANPPDLTLQAGANAVNSGSNSAAHQADDWLDADGDGNTSEDIPVDRDGNPRRNGNMDLGAYERP